MSVVTLDEFKRFLSVDLSDTSEDTFYQELLDRAEQRIGNVFGGALSQADYTEIYDFDNLIFPKHYPIVSVSSVKIDGVTQSGGVDYFVYDDYIVLMGEGECKSVEITYTAGFDPVPEDIKQAIILTAAFYMRMNSELKPEVQTDYRMPQEVENIFAPYRRIAI